MEFPSADLFYKNGKMLIKKDPMKPVIVVFGKASFFGDAPFVALEKFLIPRLIALGIGIDYVDEYFSSQKCPTCKYWKY